MQTLVSNRWLPVSALLIGATSWGILWCPFRLLNEGGIPVLVATTLCYVVTLVLAAGVLPHSWRDLPRQTGTYLGIAVAAGVTNVAYLAAVMEGEVVRIVLLFYLAPLWTVPLARLLLQEKLTLAGFATMALALAGAVTMLWQPALGWPAPRNTDEWLGLLAGFAFALSNVLVKRAHHAPAESKSIATALGVFLIALPAACFVTPSGFDGLTARITTSQVLMVFAIGVTLFATNLALQYGLNRIMANRAAVILLFELVIAAIAAHLLVNEVTRALDWVGGSMIVLAGLWATLARDPASPLKTNPARSS